mgnify:CR=1 FL=1
MKLIKVFLSKLYIYLLLIVIQMFYVFILFTYLTDINQYVNAGFTLFSLGIVLWLVNKEENLNYKIGWIIIVLVFPSIGGLMYLMMGNKNAARFLSRKIRRGNKKVSQYLLGDDSVKKNIINKNLISLEYLENLHFPIYKNTDVKYYALGDDSYYDLLKDLRNAKRFIFMEYFIVSKGIMFDSIFAILREKVKEGVEVRFIYDDFGSISTIPFCFKQKLEKWGIKYVVFNRFVPLFSVSQNHRDHRKICVIDGYIGYSGGFNLADEYINAKERFGHWKDAGVRIEGDAVWSLTAMFLSAYYTYHPKLIEDPLIFKSDCITKEYTGYVLPYGDDPLDNEGVGENVYLNLITHAAKEIKIMTPYFIIDDTLMKALKLASRNGIKVKIFTPHIPDKKIVFRVTRSYYYSLIMDGIEVYEYTPGFLHSKVILVDNKAATVGTINFDYRSLYLHFENNILLYQSKAIKDIKEDFIYTESISQRVSMKKARYFKGFIEAILRLFAPLL